MDFKCWLVKPVLFPLCDTLPQTHCLYPGSQVYLGRPALAKALLGQPQGQQGTKVQAHLLAGIRALRLNLCMKFISVLFLLSWVLFLDWLPPSPHVPYRW